MIAQYFTQNISCWPSHAYLTITGRRFLLAQITPFQALSKYSRDLTQAARDGKLDPVIGRDDEIRRTVQILSRRTKNNPILLGEPGMSGLLMSLPKLFRRVTVISLPVIVILLCCDFSHVFLQFSTTTVIFTLNCGDRSGQDSHR